VRRPELIDLDVHHRSGIQGATSAYSAIRRHVRFKVQVTLDDGVGRRSAREIRLLAAQLRSAVLVKVPIGLTCV
jgi:hypothetical protein